MPTYQYACRSCDHRFETVQGFHEDALTLCPACNENGLRKLFGNVGVVFKGSGFYRTDSRASSEKQRTKKESSDKDAAASKSEPSSTQSSKASSSTSSDSGSGSGSSSKVAASA